MTVLDKSATALNRRDDIPNSESASVRRNQAFGQNDTVFLPGFRTEDNVLYDRECDDLIEALAQGVHGRSRAGARHLMSIPAVEAISKDERLLRIARGELGDGAIPFRATLFEKSGRA